MSVVRTLVGPLIALVGAAFFVYAIMALRTVARIVRDKTSKVVSAAVGPVELAGQLRAHAPVLALDGSPAVAVHRTFHYIYEENGDSSTSQPVSHVECVPAELSDETGSAEVEIDRFVLLGDAKRYEWTGPNFTAMHPELMQKVIAPTEKQTVHRVLASEISIADGAQAFLSGEIVALGETKRTDVYRGKRRLVVRGTDARPLVLSSWTEREVVRALLRPVLGVAGIGVLLVVLGVAAILAPGVIAARLGL